MSFDAKIFLGQALLICPWGSLGAFAFNSATKEEFFEPAEKVKAVDSLGAGDSFIAASLFALAFGASGSEKMLVTAVFVGQLGFKLLADLTL